MLLTNTGISVANVSIWIPVVIRFTTLTVCSCGAISAILTYTPTHSATSFIYFRVKVAFVSVIVTVALWEEKNIDIT